MRTYIIVTEAVGALLLMALAWRIATTAWHGPRGAFRVASVGASVACFLLGVTSLQHMLHVTTRADLAPSGWGDMLLGPLAAARTTTVVLVTSCAVVAGLRQWRILGRAQSIVDVLTDRLPSGASARQARLSAREREVLDLIGRGILSDGEIGQTLHISPATAATHVQNILRKTDVHNRRDLMLIAPEGSIRAGRKGRPRAGG